MRTSMAGVLSLMVTTANIVAGEPLWKYVAEPTDNGAPKPHFRSVALGGAKPEDLREEIAYRGKERKYAQVRYGSDDSRWVAVVVDGDGDDFDLYVDADRNRVIQERDKVALVENARSAWLDAERTRGLEIIHERRLTLWRLGPGRKTISCATAGYMEGMVAIGGQAHAARRVDANANGFFADPADRVWFDLNNDKQWDPLSEQFPYVPVLTLNNQRYGLRGDAAGTRLTLEPLTAEGRIRLRLGDWAKGVTVTRLDVMLAGDDGSAFAMNTQGAAIAMPAGRYAVGSVAISVQGTDDSQPTHFIFFRVGVDRATRWHELKKDQELSIDPIGQLRFALEIDPRVRKPGEMIRVQPQLFTADGLLINSCLIGDSERGVRGDNDKYCTLKLTGANNRAIEERTTGFACGTFCPISMSIPKDADGKLQISAEFDPGPLGPPARASQTIEVRR
jgi:hypothetical protein